MGEELGVRARIVPMREGTTEIHRLQQVAAVAAARFVDMVVEEAGGTGAEEDGLVIGATWSTTMSELSAALPVRRVPGATVVQLC